MDQKEKNKRISDGKKRGWAKLTLEERKARTIHLQVECTPQKRERMSAAAKQRWQDPDYRSSQTAAFQEAAKRPEHRALIKRLAAEGVYNSNCSPRTEETKQKISDSHIALDLKGERNAMSKPCRCVETGVVYACIREATELTGIPRSSLSAALNGHQNTAHGFHFVFEEKPEYVSISKRRKGPNSATVPPNRGGDGVDGK